jgi:hypothetical protein
MWYDLNFNFNKKEEKEKIEYIYQWIVEKEASPIHGIMSDTKKFAIFHFRQIMEDLELEPGQEIEIDKNFIEVLIYELFDSTEINVKCEISQIFICLTFWSNFISEMLVDVDLISKLIELTYHNCWNLVENIIIIFGNIISSNQKNLENLTKNSPLIIRLNQLLSYDKFDGHPTIRANLLWIIKVITSKTNDDKFIIVTIYYIINLFYTPSL